MTVWCAAMGASSASPSLNHGAARRMVPFDHIAVMGIFGLNALDTLPLQISLLITMESNGGDFCTPVGCIRAGTRKVSLRRAASAVIAGLCIASRVYPTCGILI